MYKITPLHIQFSSVIPQWLVHLTSFPGLTSNGQFLNPNLNMNNKKNLVSSQTMTCAPLLVVKKI